MSVLLNQDQLRSFRNQMTVGTDLTPTGASNNTPAVITATAHGLTSGQIVAQWGFTTNTNCNGVFWITVINANTYKISNSLNNYLFGTFVAGNGATTAGHAIAITGGIDALFAKDIDNIKNSLSRVKYVKLQDFLYTPGSFTSGTTGAWAGSAPLNIQGANGEDTLATIFGL